MLGSENCWVIHIGPLRDVCQTLVYNTSGPGSFQYIKVLIN